MNNLKNPRMPAVIVLVSSVVFAALILLVSYWLADSDSKDTLVFLLIALWWIPFSYLTSAAGCGCRKD
jgi:hypothetical protein